MTNIKIQNRGLMTKEAEALLVKHGLNEIKEGKNYTILTSFLSQFTNFLTLLLVGAGGVSFLLGEQIDGFFIFMIVILNAFFGVYQEFKAEKALETLKNLTTTNVRVIRDGREQEIDSRFLVPGDVMYVEEGARISADGTIFSSWHLEINEASLTGESAPVPKDSQKDRQIFMGTVVSKGRGYVEISATGEDTKFGKIARTLKQIKKGETPLQKKLETFTKQIGVIGVIAAIIVFLISFIREKSVFESFILAVSLAVAAVPEGLPAVMTITLAIGVERMAREKAIIRKLNAIETLGSVTLVATDKTGTLTTNQMTVKKIWIDGKIHDVSEKPALTNNVFSKMILNGILCSTASIVKKVDHGTFDVIGDTTEGAMLLLAQKTGLIPQMVRDEWRLVDETGFDPVTKRMTVVVKKTGKERGEQYVFSKGAPESILAVCDRILMRNAEHKMTDDKKAEIEKEFEVFAKKGLRMLAFGYKPYRLSESGPYDTGMIFLGFVGIADPIRTEVKEAVLKAQRAGIRVVMITGDNELTAEAIGIEAGIIKEGQDILTGSQIEQYSDEDLIRIMPRVSIYARTSPQHKFKLVQLFQKLGEVTAVTGDGVNDALALKQADVGVSMGITGTDVAKETADMIVTDDNFATLISAIEQGRNIFNHIKNAIKYLLSCNIGEVIYILFAVFFGLPVLTPLQILYINLATDGLPAVALAFAPPDREIMSKLPRRSMTFFDRKDYGYIFLIGGLTAILTFFAMLAFYTKDEAVSKTMLFTTLSLLQPIIMIDLWLSHNPLAKNMRFLKHPIFIAAFLMPFVVHPFLLYLPFLQTVFKTVALSPESLLVALGFATVILVPIELLKIRR